MTKFLRRTWNRYSKLGKGRKKKQKWRKPKGRDNKMREKRRGYPKTVSIGYKGGHSERKKIKVVYNLDDLKNIQKGEFIVLGKLGKKKKIEILNRALEKGIKFQNINIKKFLKKFEVNEGNKENKITAVK
ncbi:MAG: eL32 family ribosomal protein [Candidatus Pacearchaeota archaeon]